VSVVDHDQSTRQALELLISSAGWRARTYASARDFLARPRILTPGCLIVDVTLPDLHGLELQQRIADRYEMPIIFITGQSDIRTVVRAMRAGALEFMVKPFRDEAMVGAIAGAIEHSRAALTREAELGCLRECHASLSCRERQVMALVVQGLRNRVIATALSICEITVKVHRGRVMRKMNARSVPELVTIAARLARTPQASDDRKPRLAISRSSGAFRDGSQLALP
jgi:FixJ family two-component response regulator